MDARADRGDKAVGLSAGGAYPEEVRVAAHFELGLSQWFALRFNAGGAAGLSAPHRGSGLADASLVWAYDVVQWVPSVEFLQGTRFDENSVEYRGGLLAGVRYYVARRWAIAIHGGAEFTTPDQVWGVLRFAVWRSLR